MSISPGTNHTQCIEIVFIDDNVLEEDEHVVISLSNNDTGVLLTPSVLTIQILDDDSEKNSELILFVINMQRDRH